MSPRSRTCLGCVSSSSITPRMAEYCSWVAVRIMLLVGRSGTTVEGNVPC